MTLHDALSALLARLEAGDAVGAAEVLPLVEQQLTGAHSEPDLLALRLLNGRCEEAAQRLLHGVEQELRGTASSNRAISAYDDPPF